MFIYTTGPSVRAHTTHLSDSLSLSLLISYPSIQTNMEYRCLEINVMFAKNPKNVNLTSKMRPYAVVSIYGDPRGSQQQRTAVDRSGNASPTWNPTLKFTVEESATRSNRLGVTFRIRCERTVSDKDIGEVHVPLSELNGPTEDGELLHSVTYQLVRRPSGKPNKGELNFSYKWGPVTAYPAQVGPSPVSLPPPTEYDPLLPPPGNGYPPVQQRKMKKWWAKFLCVLGKLCGDVIADVIGDVIADIIGDVIEEEVP